jgi:hypothetical protein
MKLPTDTAQDKIDYLVLRRYPFARLLDLSPSLSSLSAPPRVSDDDRKRVISYRSELSALAPDELTERLKQERAKEAEELRQKAEREEQQRFFNQARANADFSHWSKAAHWTLDEALALSFGKAPEKVTWKNVEPYRHVSPFAFQYQRRRDLALRALQWKQLFDPVLPGIFLAWCKRTDLAVPAELEVAVTARGVQVADWQSLYNDLKSTFEKAQASAQRQDEQWRELVKQKDELIASLNRQVIDAQQTLPPQAEKSLGARERDSLLKLIIGMAVGGYGHDPYAKRSEQPAAIADDLARRGIPLDADTVRKWLREAAELLPKG